MRPDRYYINIIITSSNQRHGSPEPNQMHDSIIDTHSALCSDFLHQNNPHYFYLRGVESLMSEQFWTMQNLNFYFYFDIHRSHFQPEQWRQLNTRLSCLWLVISGLQIHDTCGSPELAQEHLYQIISSVQNQRNVTSQPRLIGELEVIRD